MFLKKISDGHLVEILSLKDLFDPFNDAVVGRLHFGEELQDPDTFKKDDLQFLSGEAMPACWTDSHYRDDELKRTG